MLILLNFTLFSGCDIDSPVVRSYHLWFSRLGGRVKEGFNIEMMLETWVGDTRVVREEAEDGSLMMLRPEEEVE